MARGRKPAINKEAASLIAALDFCGIIKAPTTTAQPYHYFIMINQGWAVSHDGVIAVGTKVDIDVNGIPHFKKLREAMNNVGKNFSLTVKPNGSFEVVSGDYNAVINALDPAQLVPTPPNSRQWPLDDRFKDAMAAASKIVSASAETLVQAAVYSTGPTLISTNGYMAIEAWHGNQFPPGLIFPKEFAVALAKTKKTVTGFGFGDGTFTVWFEDNSFVRTNLYDAEWPQELQNINHMFGANTNEGRPIPEDFYKAVDHITPFQRENKELLFGEGTIRTHPSLREGAAIKFEKLNIEGVYMSDLVKITDGMSHTFAQSFSSGSPRKLEFYGDIVRGVIAGSDDYISINAGDEWQQGNQTPEPEPEPEQETPQWGTPGGAEAWVSSIPPDTGETVAESPFVSTGTQEETTPFVPASGEQQTAPVSTETEGAAYPSNDGWTVAPAVPASQEPTGMGDGWGGHKPPEGVQAEELPAFLQHNG